jgi:hypothetical protein
VNLELPLVVELEPSPLDEYLAAIDRELDALFLDDVDGAVQRLRGERLDAACAGAVA